MIRLMALWSVFLAGTVLALVLREEKLVTRGKVPLGRLRRLWFRNERRRAPRYRVNWGVRYLRQEGNDPHPGNGQTRDVSQTGAGLIIHEKLAVGSFIHVELTVPEKSLLLRALAEIVWIKEVTPAPAAQGRAFFAGIHFHNLAPELEQQMRKALVDGRAL